ncbi:MAG: ATP-grasp domain-containing protein [Caldiserica bacterium]|nr:ATP-grasp domain-containing protein [Caldisericota bacterium]MDH7562213.1 ATP-grasp domain-containing protein [Caldisericota bacterium]
MRIAILLKKNFSSSPEDQKRKKQQEKTCQAVKGALQELGYEVSLLYLSPPDFSKLEHPEFEAVFNLYTSTGKEQALVAGLLELSGIPFTGSSALGHFLALAKPIAKSVWAQRGISTPLSFFPPRPADDDFPLIVKPAFGGSGEGISSSSIVKNQVQLDKALKEMERFSPLFVEKFIQGRELTVGIIGDPPLVLPPLEVSFDLLPEDEARINSFQAKTVYSDLVEVKPAILEEKERSLVEQTALEAFKSLGLRDLARCDLRMDETGKPFILEINSLPGLEPGYSDLPKAAEAGGFSYSELISRILSRCLKEVEF